MKYLEEINPGDIFSIDNIHYLLTIDFKKNGSRLVYRLDNGSPAWLAGNSLVQISPIYYLDKENNIVPMKLESQTDVVH